MNSVYSSFTGIQSILTDASRRLTENCPPVVRHTGSIAKSILGAAAANYFFPDSSAALAIGACAGYFMPNSLSSYNPLAAAEPQPQKTARKIEEIDIQIGSSNILIDGIRNISIFSILQKVLLFNRHISSGNVSEETIGKVREYLHENNLHDVVVAVNQYKPQEVWKRILTNPKTSLLSKYTVGIATALAYTFCCTKLTGLPGDHYDPLSNRIHLFSNEFALHECGHAKDFNERKNPSLYRLPVALEKLAPLVAPSLSSVAAVISSATTLFQEYKATDNAIRHLSEKGRQDQVKGAFKVLIPAYATYCANAILPHILVAPDYSSCFSWWRPDVIGCIWQETQPQVIGVAAIVIAGHIIGHALAAKTPSQAERDSAIKEE